MCIVVTNDFVSNLLEVANENGIHCEIFEGTLNDNVIVYDAYKIKIKGIRRAKHIIIQSVPLNEWSSELRLIVTDRYKLVEEKEKEFSRSLTMQHT